MTREELMKSVEEKIYESYCQYIHAMWRKLLEDFDKQFKHQNSTDRPFKIIRYNRLKLPVEELTEGYIDLNKDVPLESYEEKP